MSLKSMPKLNAHGAFWDFHAMHIWILCQAGMLWFLHVSILCKQCRIGEATAERLT